MANTPSEHKSALRAAARERRRSANPQTGQALCDAALGLHELATAACVAAYVARMGEPDTAPLLAALAARGTPVLLPVLLPDLDLDWAMEDGSRRMSQVRAGLAEPAGPPMGRIALGLATVVVAPALAVDRSGVRLGHGGGSYDRALAAAGRGAFVVALLHEGELTDSPLPAEPHDRPVDAVVLPSGVVRFRR